MTKLVFVCMLMAVSMAAGAAAQGNSFADPNVAYSFGLPDDRWKMTIKPSATNANVEYVFGDRLDGHLEVRRMSVARDTIITEVIASEQEKLQFRPGYVAGREENFSGRYRGGIYNFEYISAGRNMSGRFYFLRTDETTVYVLRFTGQKDSLRSIRHQTDSIARTFLVKQG